MRLWSTHKTMTQNNFPVFGKGGGARVTDYIAKLQEYHLLPTWMLSSWFPPTRNIWMRWHTTTRAPNCSISSRTLRWSLSWRLPGLWWARINQSINHDGQVRESVPIKCMEAVVLAIYLTNGIPGLGRCIFNQQDQIWYLKWIWYCHDFQIPNQLQVRGGGDVAAQRKEVLLPCCPGYCLQRWRQRVTINPGTI